MTIVYSYLRLYALTRPSMLNSSTAHWQNEAVANLDKYWERLACRHKKLKGNSTSKFVQNNCSCLFARKRRSVEMVVLPFLSHVHTKPDIFETAFFFIRIRVDRLVKAVYGQVARKSSRPKLCRRKCLGLVARNADLCGSKFYNT